MWLALTCLSTATCGFSSLFFLIFLCVIFSQILIIYGFLSVSRCHSETRNRCELCCAVQLSKWIHQQPVVEEFVIFFKLSTKLDLTKWALLSRLIKHHQRLTMITPCSAFILICWKFEMFSEKRWIEGEKSCHRLDSLLTSVIRVVDNPFLCVD